MKTLNIALVCALSSFIAIAQDAPPKKPDPAAPKTAAGAKKEAAPVTPLDPVAEAWVKQIANRIADSNKTIKEGASAAVEKVGKPALPILNALATGTDKELADAAKKLADKIEKGPQQRGPGGMKSAADLAKEMNLDEKKTAKLTELEKASKEKISQLMESMRNGDVTPEEMRTEMQQYRQEMSAELRKFLSEDEAKKVEDNMPRGGRMGGGGNGGGGNGGGRRPGGGGN